MKKSAILEEVWRTKDELAREAGYDVHRFFEKLRSWSQENPHAGPVVRDAEALRRLASEQERDQMAEPILHERRPGDIKSEGQS
jgi:hypothetical protein